jgi:hypothetical protein
MMRWLMSWCVPSRALRFHNEAPSDRDVAGGRNLLIALASHGIGRNADPAPQQSA